MKRQSISIATIVVVSVLVSSGTLLASAPEPVLPIGDAGPPAYDPTEPYRDDQGGRCPAGNIRMGTNGELDLTIPPASTRLPGPVVPVEAAPAAPPCLADVGLYLVIEAPDGKKPEGADGNLDGIAVPRSSLEGGFEVTLPAQDRLITLTGPGQDWDLKSTSCSCSGWTTLTASTSSTIASAPGERTSFPRPVVPVASPSGGPGGCSGSSPADFSAAASSPGLPVWPERVQVTTYPGPVIPVDSMPRLEAPKVEWDSDGTVTITDPDQVGGTFTCVWTVELAYGQLDIETVTKPAGEAGRFRYEVVPTGGQPNASPLTVRGSASERLHWGPWSVDLATLPEGWKLERSSCSESDTPLVSLASGSSATVGLDPGDAVSCKFELALLAPKPGRWKTNNKDGTVVCSKGAFAIPFDLSRAVDFGRLQVRDEGDTLIARGGGNSFTFRRDRNDPLRYAGTKRFRQAGFTLDFDIRLDLKSETRMTGTLRAKAKGKGLTCTIRQALTLTYAN